MAAEHPIDIREEIVAAAERIIVDRGLGAATTRAIAQGARCAEGSIYRYFPHKHALFVEVIKRRYPQFTDLLASLPDRVGNGTVQKTLEELVAASLEFYRAIMPMAAGTIAEHELLEAQRRHFEESGGGPAHSLNAVADYIRKEQRLGRLSTKVSAVHVGRLLLGSSFGQAFMEAMLGPAFVPTSDQHYAREIVKSLMEGMAPRPTLREVAEAVRR